MNAVNIKVMNQSFTIRGSESPDYIIMVAEELNKIIEDLQQSKPNLSVVEAAILSALNALDEKLKATSECDKIKGEYDKPHQELKKAFGQIEILKQQLSLEKGEVLRLKDRYNKIMAKDSEKESTSKEIEEKLLALSNELSEKDSIINNQKDEIIRLDTEVSRLTEFVEDVARVERLYKDATSENIDLKDSIAAKDIEVMNLREELQSRDKQIKGFVAEKERFERIKEEFSRELLDLKEQISVCRMATKDDSIDALKDDHKVKEQELTKEKERILAENRDLKERLESVESSLFRSTSETKTFRDEISRLKGELDQKEREILSIKDEQDSSTELSNQYSSLMDQFEKLSSDNLSLQSQIQTLQSELEDYKDIARLAKEDAKSARLELEEFVETFGK